MTSSHVPPQLMRAAVASAPGVDPALAEIPVPRPGPGEVLIEIMASSVNPTDVMTWRRGAFVTGEAAPFVGGYDVAGFVIDTGPGVTTLRRGDCVAGMPRFPHPASAFAQFTTATARHVARVPDSQFWDGDVDWAQLAALPLAGLTAWQAIVDTANVTAGSKVLIHAASGGVGHLAVQLAAHLGAEVTAITSSRGRALVETLGAARVIDRATSGWPAQVPPQDLVLDTVGGDVTSLSLALAAPTGLVVALHPYAHDDLAKSDRRLSRMLVEPDHTALTGLLELHRQGHLRPHIGATYDLTDTGAALRHVEHSRTPGKTVINTH